MVVVTEQVRFGRGKEEGRGRIRRIVGNRREGENAPRKDNGPVKRAGAQSSNLTY